MSIHVVRFTAGLVLTLAISACQDQEIAGPAEPEVPSQELLGSAIRLHVDLKAGKVAVTQPSLVEKAARGDGLTPSFALLGQNEIEVKVGALKSPAGGDKKTGNYVRVVMSMALTNRLQNSDLKPSTFPQPPVQQVVAFPFATEPAGLFGWKVRASSDWDGAPHNFFNDGICLGLPTPPGDCFRYEPFGEELPAGGTTESREVGFDVHSSVDAFTVYVALAADVHDRDLPGNIAGTVSSTLFGPLANVLVTASPAVRPSPGERTERTGPAGDYLFTSVPALPVSLSVAETPPSCFRASKLLVHVKSGVTTRADFDLRCRRILIVALGDNTAGSDVYVMQADGSGRTRLTDSPGPDENPTWSPDGSRVAFVSSRNGNPNIFVMNADGTEPIQLTASSGDINPEWSPDGSKIAFTSFRNFGHRELYVMNANGSGQARLTDSPFADDEPSWSPDGSKLAFSARIASGRREIFVVNSDGTNRVQLTNRFFVASHPTWSPDGSRIAFSGLLAGNEDSELYVMDANGSDPLSLTDNSALDDWPAWSPDGSKLVFVSDRDDPGTLTGRQIYMVDADGRNPVRLTDDDGTVHLHGTW